MVKRLMEVASAEGLKFNEIAVEELADKVNGDMRMGINQLQYMSLSSNSVIVYDDITKDEDISPFTAVHKLFTSDKLRMDQKIELSMSDADLVPLLIQENYINYRARRSINKNNTENELKHLSLVAKAGESIADGDIVNVQIRKYQQWQLSQISLLASSIIPCTLLNGQRTILEQGERNFNRFGSWLGKNSTTGKNYRLLEDLHVHLLASRKSYLGRKILRVDYMTLLKKQLSDPLRNHQLSKDEAVEKVINFMDSYSISMDDYDSIMEICTFQWGQSSHPLDGILPAVKSALTRGYNKGSKSRVIKINLLPGIKKAPKKRVAAIMLEQLEQEDEEDDEEEDDDAEDDDSGKKLQSLKSKGIQVEMELKGKKTPASRGKGSSTATKRKR